MSFQGRIETTRDCSSDPATCRKLRQGHWSHTAQASPTEEFCQDKHTLVLSVWITPSLFRTEVKYESACFYDLYSFPFI